MTPEEIGRLVPRDRVLHRSTDTEWIVNSWPRGLVGRLSVSIRRGRRYSYLNPINADSFDPPANLPNNPTAAPVAELRLEEDRQWGSWNIVRWNDRFGHVIECVGLLHELDEPGELLWVAHTEGDTVRTVGNDKNEVFHRFRESYGEWWAAERAKSPART